MENINDKIMLFEPLIIEIFNQNDIFKIEPVIEHFHSKYTIDDFHFYEGLVESIKNSSVSFNEKNNFKFQALNYCWNKIKYVCIDKYLLKKNYSTLSGLQTNNLHYEKLIERFTDKLEVSKPFLSKEEFIEEEKKRIKTVFIKPLVTTVFGDFKKGKEFNYTKYKQYAYDLLSSGEDFPLRNIVFNALSEYETIVDVERKYDSKSTFEPLVIHSIVLQVSEGVAYLMYEKFLKDKLNTTDANNSRVREKNLSNKKQRKNPSNKVRALLQKEINSRCSFCSSEDVDHFEIHHIDENPLNNILTNLLMLCPTCHSKITKGDITKEVVLLKKASLESTDLDNTAGLFISKEFFKKKLNDLLSNLNSVYYIEVKEHWNSYSLINDYPFLNEIINKSLSKSIEYGILPIISDIVSKHLYYDKEAKYLYNQQHIYMHNSEDKGYNLPVYYHIRFVGILYATAIRNKVDIDVVAHHYKNMQSIFSSMVKGIIDNLNVGDIDDTKEYPTNYHWLIGEILSITNQWIDSFNERDRFVKSFSYINFIPFTIQLCFSEMYKGIMKGKLEINFVVNQFYYKVLSTYFSPLLNNALRKSIEETIISEIPKQFLKLILNLSLDEAYAITVDEFLKGKFRVLNNTERKILDRFRNFLIKENKI